MNKEGRHKDAFEFFKNSDIFSLGEMSNEVRANKHGNKAFYALNAAITYSNSCELMCPICSFARAKGHAESYILSLEEVHEKAEFFKNLGANEIHIIGGINHDIDFNYYVDVIKTIKNVSSEYNIVAYTASECVMMSEVAGKSLEWVYKTLQDAGLDALPGGGAEIFDDAVRAQITPKKLSGKNWLAAHKIAHQCGIRTNATMLYGHVENLEQITDHLIALRNLQEETGGFKAFVPLPFRKGKSSIKAKESSLYDTCVCSYSRIILDNFDHVRVPVTHFSDRFAQVLLHFGADDIGGTHWSEEVAKSAGANFVRLTEDDLIKTIKSSGFIPVKTNSNYE